MSPTLEELTSAIAVLARRLDRLERRGQELRKDPSMTQDEGPSIPVDFNADIESDEKHLSRIDHLNRAVSRVRTALFFDRPKNERPLVASYAFVEVRKSNNGGVILGRPSVAEAECMSGWDDIHIAESFTGLANEQRVRIVKSLLFGEKTAKDLMLELTLTSSQLYHHIRELAKSGYLSSAERSIYKLSHKGQYVAGLLFAYFNDEPTHPGETLLDPKDVPDD